MVVPYYTIVWSALLRFMLQNSDVVHLAKHPKKFHRHTLSHRIVLAYFMIMPASAACWPSACSECKGAPKCCHVHQRGNGRPAVSAAVPRAGLPQLPQQLRATRIVELVPEANGRMAGLGCQHPQHPGRHPGTAGALLELVQVQLQLSPVQGGAQHHCNGQRSSDSIM